MALREDFIKQGNLLFKYRSYFPVIPVLVGLAIYIQQQYLRLEGTESYFSQISTFLCLGFSFLGFLIRFLSVGYSADNTSGRNTTAGQIADDINTTGLYSICRHPLYVGNFFIWLGVACFTQHLWFSIAFIFIYWVYYERIMFAEEEFLRDKYDDSYTKWSLQTPAFVPELGLWKSPKLSFSWVKVIRQEKSGILNLFLILFVFDLIGKLVTGQEIVIDNNVWAFAFAAALIYYVIIKALQKSTDILELDRS